MVYKLIGMAVVKGGKVYLRRRYGPTYTPKPVLAAVVIGGVVTLAGLAPQGFLRTLWGPCGGAQAPPRPPLPPKAGAGGGRQRGCGPRRGPRHKGFLAPPGGPGGGDRAAPRPA